MTLVGWSVVVLVGFAVLSGFGLRFLQPGIGFEGPVPWALPGLIASGFNKGIALPLPELLFGSVTGIVVAFIGGWDATRRDVF
jgi:hypothetical protein